MNTCTYNIYLQKGTRTLAGIINAYVQFITHSATSSSLPWIHSFTYLFFLLSHPFIDLRTPNVFRPKVVVLRLLGVPAAPPERRCKPCNVFKPTNLEFGFVVKGWDLLLLLVFKSLVLALFDIEDIVVECRIDDWICGGFAFGNVEVMFTVDGVEVEVEVDDASDDDVFGFFDASSSSFGSSAGSLEKQWW